MSPPCATCPNAPKTPTEWFNGLGFATQLLLVLILVSSIVFNVVSHTPYSPTGDVGGGMKTLASVLISALLYIPRSLLDCSPVISITFLFKMIMMAGVLDRVEKQVCGEYLGGGRMAFPGNRLFTPSELAHGARAINRDLLVRSLRLLWTYTMVGLGISILSITSAIIVVVGQSVWYLDLWGLTLQNITSRMFFASEVMSLALMFLLGSVLPQERMALPSFLSGMLSKSSGNQQKRGFATGQNMNTYEQFKEAQDRKRGLPVLRVAMMYLAVDLLFFGSSWVSSISAFVVGRGIGVALSKSYERERGGGGDGGSEEGSDITSDHKAALIVHTCVDHFVTTFLGKFVLRNLAKMLNRIIVQATREGRAVPEAVIRRARKLQETVEGQASYLSNNWVFRPLDHLDVPSFIYVGIRNRNLKKYDKLKANGAKTPWAKN